MTSSELSIAPGRTLATMLFTASDIASDDDEDRSSHRRSEALMMTPDDTAADDRGRLVYLPPDDMSLVDDVIAIADNDTSSWSELVQRERDGGQRDREPARQ